MSSKYVNFITPKATVKYPKLDQPYTWSQAQNRSVPDPDGQYEAVLVMSEQEAAPFLKTLKEAIKASGIDPKNLPFKKEIDKDTKKPTGNIEFKFKAYGKTKTGERNRVKLVDAKLRPLPSSFRLTTGSTVAFSGYVTVAKLGARLNLRGVQVISLADTHDAGFEAAEGFEWDGEEDDYNNNNSTETTVGGTTAKADEHETFDF